MKGKNIRKVFLGRQYLDKKRDHQLSQVGKVHRKSNQRLFYFYFQVYSFNSALQPHHYMISNCQLQIRQIRNNNHQQLQWKLIFFQLFYFSQVFFFLQRHTNRLKAHGLFCYYQTFVYYYQSLKTFFLVRALYIAMAKYLFLELLFFFINITNTQMGIFGCMSALNTDINCPVNRSLEIIIWTGKDNGANSDSLDITASFYDAKKNLIAALPLKWPNCNPFEKGSVDTVKACANWVELANSVTFTIEKSDEMQVEALTVALGERTAVHTMFWFDDVVKGNYEGWPVFNKLELTPVCHK